MTESEIVELVRLVNAAYQNAKPVPPEALPIWHEDLAELSAAVVRAAFTAYRRRGSAFPPNSAELRQVAAELAHPAVTFEQVWAEIHRAVRNFGWPRALDAHLALAEVPFALDLVAALGGWPAVCQAGPDEARPTDPGVWRSQAEHAFKALLAQRRDDEAVAGLPGARAAAASQRLAEAMTPPALPEPKQLPPAEPLRVIELPAAKTLDGPSKPAIVLPPPGPAYKHGPSCVCERCMPMPAMPAPIPSPPPPPRRARRRGRARRLA